MQSLSASVWGFAGKYDLTQSSNTEKRGGQMVPVSLDCGQKLNMLCMVFCSVVSEGGERKWFVQENRKLFGLKKVSRVN